MIIGVVLAVAVLVTLLVLARLGVFDDRDEAAGGDKGLSPVVSVVGRKGIYDRNSQELAVSFRQTSVYARPLEIVDIEATARDIAAVLKMDKQELQSLLKVERSFVWLGRELSADQAEKILGLGIPGIYGIDEMHRFYPHSQIAAPVLGFVKDDQGLAGIEFQYDNVLRGIVGKDADLAGAGMKAKGGAEESGADLILSLDISLQSTLEKRLDAVIKGAQATSGVAVVMDAKTGAVLALASLPAYDPNSYWAFDATERRNRAVIDPVFDGGICSFFKAAAAYDQQGEIAATEDEEGGGQWLQADDGVFVSGNLGRVGEVAVGNKVWQGFVDRLALRAGSGVDLPGDQAAAGERRFCVGEATAATSAMDLLTAFARTMNGGVLVKPRLLAGVRPTGGEWTLSGASADGAVKFRAGLASALSDILGRKVGKRQELIVESRLAEQLVESHSPTQGREAAGITEAAPPVAAQPVAATAVDATADAAAADAAADGQDAPEAEVVRYYATMLGMVADSQSNLVMVASLTGSRFDAAAPSPLAELGREILSTAAGLGQVKADRTAERSSAKSKGMYDAWMEQQQEPAEQQSVAPSHAAGVMPDVGGQSLRKALQTLQPHGLPVRVRGNGRVVAQKPTAGAALKGAREITLMLKLEQ